MMNRGDIRTRALHLANERTYGHWPKSILNEDLNIQYKQLVRRIRQLMRRHYQTSATITTTASTWTVNIPSDCKQVINLKDSDGNEVLKGVKADFDSSDTGEPSYFDFYNYSTLCFDVTPDSTYSYTIQYIYEPDDFSSDSDEPDLPSGGDEIIAMMTAYSLTNSRGDESSIDMYRRMKAERDDYLSELCRGYAGGPERIRRGDRNYGINDWRSG